MWVFIANKRIQKKFEFGCYTSELDAVSFGKEFQKVPEPDLDEILEIESASFLSFNETLRQ